MVDAYDAVLLATYNLYEPAPTYQDIVYIASDDIRLLAAAYGRSDIVYMNPQYQSYCVISGYRYMMSGLAYDIPAAKLYSKCAKNDYMYKFNSDCTEKTFIVDMGVVFDQFKAFTPDGKLTGSTQSTTVSICSRIHELNLVSGGYSVLYNFYPSLGVARSSGHDFLSNGNILYSELENDRIHLFNTSEEHIAYWNFRHITDRGSGLAWDGVNAWILSHSDNKLYKVSLPNIPLEVEKKKWAFHRVGVRMVRL